MATQRRVLKWSFLTELMQPFHQEHAHTRVCDFVCACVFVCVRLLLMIRTSTAFISEVEVNYYIRAILKSEISRKFSLDNKKNCFVFYNLPSVY